MLTVDVKCPGCQELTKAGDRVSHCIFHCGVYRRAGVDQKSKIAEEGTLCEISLTSGHQAAESA